MRSVSGGTAPRSRSSASARPGHPIYRGVLPHGSPQGAVNDDPTILDGVFGGLGGVLAPARGGPGEAAVRMLLDVPAGVLLELMLVTALRTGVTHTGPAAFFVGDVVLEVGAP